LALVVGRSVVVVVFFVVGLIFLVVSLLLGVVIFAVVGVVGMGPIWRCGTKSSKADVVGVVKAG
jgi:hypothetical protein